MRKAEPFRAIELELTQLDSSEPDQLSSVLHLGTESFSDLGSYRQTIEYWILQDGVQTTVALKDNELLGFVTYAFLRDEVAEPVGDVIAIAVADGVRRAGVGTALLRHALAWLTTHANAINARYLRLAVSDENASAQALFHAAGFKKSRSKGLYPNGQRCTEMTFILPS